MLKTSNDGRKMLLNFDVLAQAPEGVAKLRELILTLAVQGKLVPQDASDEPASVLLQRIHAEKARLVAEGKIKKEKTLLEITEEEKPFELPVGWEWVRLGEVTNYGSPNKAKEIYENTWVLDMEDVEKNSGRLLKKIFFKDRASLSEKNAFEKNDVIYGKLRPYLNKVLVADEGGVCTTEFVPINSYGFINPYYLKLSLSNPVFLSYVEAKLYGMKMPRLGTTDARNALISVPPIAEQSRIVARVESLMQLCDALEAKGQLEASQHQQLLQALLGSLTQSADAAELAHNWQRVAAHFDLLLDRPEAIDALEQTILQLAVRGLLTKQDVSEFCAEIESSKEEDRDFLPANWCATRLGNVAQIKLGGTPSRQVKDYWGGNIKWVSSGEVANCRIFDSEEKITEAGLNNSNAKIYPIGTVLIAMIGQGKTRGQSAILNIEACTNQNVAAIIIDKKYLNSEYVFIWALSEYAKTRSGGRGGAQPALNGGIVRSLFFPLPPLAEQFRIVARVNELCALCQQLREKLSQARHTQSLLAQAWVEQAAA